MEEIRRLEQETGLLIVPDVTYAPHQELEVDRVITTEPAPGTEITSGDVITIVLSNAETPDTAPSSFRRVGFRVETGHLAVFFTSTRKNLTRLVSII